MRPVVFTAQHLERLYEPQAFANGENTTLMARFHVLKYTLLLVDEMDEAEKAALFNDLSKFELNAVPPLRRGQDEDRVGALSRLRRDFSQATLSKFRHALKGEDPAIERAIETLERMASALEIDLLPPA